MGRTVIAFDLYGTILSTESIAGELAKLYGQDKAQSIASLARRYQLEYTWRANSMGKSNTIQDKTIADSIQRNLSLV
jgi:2-haloacid dehalogenase